MKNLFSLTILAAALMFAACSDDTTPNPKTLIQPGTESGFKDLRNDALKDLIQKKTFDVAEGITFTTDKGVTFSYSGNLWDMSGNPVSGIVDLEYAEIFDRGNMAAANKPLMGKDASGNLRPLITGGEFYVNMSQNGNQLRSYWNPYHITAPASLTSADGTPDPSMILWEGTIDEEGDLFWDQFNVWNGEKERNGGVDTDYTNNSYKLWCSDFCWTNIDVLAGEEGEQTPIFVKPPRGWNNKNSCVYVAYKGKAGSLAFLDTYKETEGYFTEHYGWAPIGYVFYVIFTAESNGKYVYWIKEITVAKNTVIEVPQDQLGTCTKEEFIEKINKLP